MTNELKKILLLLNIGNEDFFEYITKKVKVYPLEEDLIGWGCFSICNQEGILIDIKLLVPKIINQKTLLINIHEFTHAFELYSKLDTYYEENTLESEKLAKEKEEQYLRLYNKKSS